ncbi:uncharacterized protein LOC141644258 [Silene latifolia]|uniref:uncharacterized protein LOC141644258 n=1 Tax=Silene latifolia TaxID=37657 RepID=UPI003D778B4F
MRLLEKYKGERRTCVLGLQDNNQVKVFGTRACYELLSFAGNQDFQNLRKNPRGATKDTRHCQLLDTEILARVINARKDDKYLDEIIVATEWMNVCRKAMKSLQNRQWISDTVIDMFGVMCTYNRPDILYLPSTVRYAKPQLKVNEVNFVWCPYLKMHYTPKDGATIEKVFFTIGKDDNHWLACVSDLKEEKNYILDSLRKYKKNDKKAVEEYNTYVEDIVWSPFFILIQSRSHNLRYSYKYFC